GRHLQRLATAHDHARWNVERGAGGSVEHAGLGEPAQDRGFRFEEGRLQLRDLRARTGRIPRQGVTAEALAAPIARVVDAAILLAGAAVAILAERIVERDGLAGE